MQNITWRYHDHNIQPSIPSYIIYSKTGKLESLLWANSNKPHKFVSVTWMGIRKHEWIKNRICIVYFSAPFTFREAISVYHWASFTLRLTLSQKHFRNPNVFSNNHGPICVVLHSLESQEMGVKIKLSYLMSKKYICRNKNFVSNHLGRLSWSLAAHSPCD